MANAKLTFERSQIANFKVLIPLADRVEFPVKNVVFVCPAKAGVFSGSQPHQNKSQSSVACAEQRVVQEG